MPTSLGYNSLLFPHPGWSGPVPHLAPSELHCSKLLNQSNPNLGLTLTSHSTTCTTSLLHRLGTFSQPETQYLHYPKNSQFPNRTPSLQRKTMKKAKEKKVRHLNWVLLVLGLLGLNQCQMWSFGPQYWCLVLWSSERER
ncbi:hypothetical protein PanWU01x14_197050 [Parasponia andersonii]|uniref:Uncharacterized protein n=1 Tax=Parasponia andersonii TaxID=3476 RepID=A0A2P5BZH1_PARAD|nr:hypothetical protein PanWU01x14_197050 [Parasponia andersonii]